MSEIGTKTGFVDRGDNTGWDFITSDFTRDGLVHSLDLSLIVPSAAKLVLFRLFFSTSDITKKVLLYKNSYTNQYNAFYLRGQVANVYSETECNIQIGPDGLIKYMFETPGILEFNATIRGWWL